MGFLKKFALKWATKKVAMWVGGIAVAALLSWVGISHKSLRAEHAELKNEHATLKAQHDIEKALRISETERHIKDIAEMAKVRDAIDSERLAVQKRAFIEAGQLKKKLNEYEDAANYFDIPINEHIRLYRCQKGAVIHSQHNCSPDATGGNGITPTTGLRKPSDG